MTRSEQPGDGRDGGLDAGDVRDAQPGNQEAGSSRDGGADQDADSAIQDAGSLHDADVLDRDRPVQLALGALHSCVRTALGRVYCWGWNLDGQLGDGQLSHPSSCNRSGKVVDCSPLPVRVNLPEVSEISAGLFETCAVHVRSEAPGNVSCWGGMSAHAFPTRVLFDDAPITDAEEVSLGSDHLCVRRTDALPICRGKNGAGQLGNGSLDSSKQSVAVAASILLDVATPGELRTIVSGHGYNCALLGTARVLCWGDNTAGQCGQQADKFPVLLTARSVPDADGAVAVAAAATSMHTCFVVQGQVSCVGWDPQGEGSGGCEGTCYEPKPFLIEDTARVAQIAVGDALTCARTEDGRVFCAGDNEFGQLGPRASAPNLDVPVEVLENAVEIAVGRAHACAILSDDRVVCWGDNFGTQLGRPYDEVQQSSEPLEVHFDRLAFER
jgi:alpha-tubulin suppressor-like RCC1 family protein